MCSLRNSKRPCSLVAVDQSNDDPKISAETAIYRYHFVDRECRAVSTSPGLVTRCPGSNPVTAECDRLPAILLLYIISLLDISGRHSIVAVSGATWVNRLHLKWFSWECEVNTYNLVSKTFDSTWLYELQAFDQQDWHGNDDFLAVLRHL